MPEPISTEDLYGPSRPMADEPVVKTLESEPPIVSRPEGTLPPIEETPEIPMGVQGTGLSGQAGDRTQGTVPPPPQPPKASCVSAIAIILMLVGLVGLGIWLSSFFRQYLPNGTGGTQQQVAVTTPVATPTPSDPFASWKTYQVISGATKLPIAGVAFKLPPDVLAPICDTANCISQGTYLPGGTRFTVAPRGAGQLLADFRGRVVSDVGGIVFTTKDATVSGHTAQEFTGVFTGQTVSGYAFSRMRGFMIEVTPTLSLEINHFTPSGITADFTADDTLFNQIVKTVSFSTTLTPVITVAPIATSTPKPATSSSY